MNPKPSDRAMAAATDCFVLLGSGPTSLQSIADRIDQHFSIASLLEEIRATGGERPAPAVPPICEKCGEALVDAICDNLGLEHVDYTPPALTPEQALQIVRLCRRGAHYPEHMMVEDVLRAVRSEPAAARPVPPRSGCPCTLTVPCRPDCPCAQPFSSAPCARCCLYGSDEQRRAQAARIAVKLDYIHPSSSAPTRTA